MKKFFAIAILPAVIISFSGCWDQNLFEDTAMVLSAGIDTVEGNEGSEYEFTFAYGQPQNSQGELLTTSAESSVMEEALQSANDTMERPLVIEKLQNIIISEDAAKEGAISNGGTYYLGETSRFLADYVISESDASAVFEAVMAMEMGDSAFSYIDNLLTTSSQKGYCPNVLLHDYNLDYIKNGIDAIFPLITVEEEKVTVSGTALFHDEKMVGKFNQQETMYLLMLLAMNENTDYTINIPITNENQATEATLHINRVKSNQKPSIHDGQLTIKYDIKLYGYFDELERTRLINDFSQKEIDKAAEQHISENLVSIANTLSQLPCDPFAIEDQIRGYYPDFYKTHNFDEVYANAEFQITVEAIITNEGKT